MFLLMLLLHFGWHRGSWAGLWAEGFRVAQTLQSLFSSASITIPSR